MHKLCQESVQLHRTFEKIQLFSLKLTWVFRILFYLSCLGCVGLVGLSLYSVFMNNEVEAIWLGIIGIAPICLSYASFTLVIRSLNIIFRDISCGNSPFTHNQAARIKVISLLLLAVGVMDFFISMNYANIIDLGQYISVGYVDSMPAGRLLPIHIDLKILIASAIGFCLSTVFEYGSLLQELSDGTV